MAAPRTGGSGGPWMAAVLVGLQDGLPRQPLPRPRVPKRERQAPQVDERVNAGARLRLPVALQLPGAKPRQHFHLDDRNVDAVCDQDDVGTVSRIDKRLPAHQQSRRVAAETEHLAERDRVGGDEDCKQVRPVRFRPQWQREAENWILHASGR